MTAAPVVEGSVPALEVDRLWVRFPGRARSRDVLRGISIRVEAGERVALVGESGSGKTMLGLSVLGIAPQAAHSDGSVRVDGTEVLTAAPRVLQRLRGGSVSMVFQDPLTSLNPVRTIASQLGESARRHQGLGRGAAREVVRDTLARVGVPAPEERLGAYPHELSGGLRQRAVIALALLNRPRLIIADEPTTALDATIQAQILDVLRADLHGAALLLITHDLAVAAEVCDRVLVVYAGQVVEEGSIADLLHRPQHPYTEGLLAAVPRFDPARGDLTAIPGTPPAPDEALPGCWFAPRCAFADELCRTTPPPLVEDTGVACWHPRNDSP